jgi:hypothetical protein
MRLRIFHIISGIAILLSLASCRKEMSVETKAGLAGTFTANIDGAQWIAADSTKGASILLGMINISGISADNKQLSITLNDTLPGVYKLSQVAASLAAYADNDSSNLYAFTTDEGKDTTQAGGLVTVTEIDKVNKTISGTFSFKVYRDIDNHQKTITEGVFYKLPYVSSLPPASSLDTMWAFIDGTNWKAQSIIATALAPQLAITGSALNGSQSIGLIMPLDIQPGNYSFDYTAFTYIAIYNPTATTSRLSSSGTLVILENNPVTQRVRGNFQFRASEPLNPSIENQISGGYFSVKYK